MTHAPTTTPHQAEPRPKQAEIFQALVMNGTSHELARWLVIQHERITDLEEKLQALEIHKENQP